MGWDLVINEKVKELLGTDNDTAVDFTVAMVTDEVLNYCNLKQLPERLENIVVMMCCDALKQNGLDKEHQDQSDNIKSIHEGDTSISYISPTEVILERVKNPSFMFQYASQLNRFRRLRT